MNESEQNNIGMRIREARKHKGYSQSELANLIGKSLRTVQKYESGEIEVSIAMINSIANKLETTSTFLLGYKSEEIEFDNMVEIAEILFNLEKSSKINFTIDVKRPPWFDGWQCSLVFDGKDRDAEKNADICLFLEEWNDKREDLEEGRISQEKYDDWKDKSLAYYSYALSLKKQSQNGQ